VRDKTLLGLLVLVLTLALAVPVMAYPPIIDESVPPVTTQPPDDVGLRLGITRARRAVKPIDQPNVKDYWRNQERQRLLEAGQTAEASALGLSGTDRVLVILVEFAGTDVFTWTAPSNPADPTTGSQWDPLGIADPAEFTGVVGDCSNIMTETTVFTYTGPAHNMIERPRSPDDRSGDSIWTSDFSTEWFEGFMFGNGVVISHTMQDGTGVHESFVGQSVTDYFSDMSSGAYTVTGDVVGWVGVPHSTWYYDADECPGARSGTSTRRGVIPGAGNSRQLVKDALDAVNAISDTIPGFDWANYDLDADGIIDRLWLVHAGYGEEDSPTLLNRDPVSGAVPMPAHFYGEAAVWSHSSSVSPPHPVSPDIAAGPYIIMPENGGIGVFAHEMAHNLGGDDLYAYDQGDTSAGFWTLAADDWTGYPIGFEPPAVDPWHLDNWGWLDAYVISDTSEMHTVTLGQASGFPDGADMYRGVKITLEDGVLELPVPVWEGNYYWWGGSEDLANAMMTTKNPIDLTGAPTATLSFDMVYDTEDEWDFLWVQVSPDGVNWDPADTLTNANTQCVHNSGWIGGAYGFPEDLCGAGIGGFYGWNPSWPDPDEEVFDLTAYAGRSVYLRFWFMTDWDTTYTGVFIDNVEVETAGGTVLSSGADAGEADWDYQAPWVRSNGTMPYTHNFYLQWRNVNDNGGYDSALGDPRWRFGPANTGLLVWYNNNFYSDNEIWQHWLDGPSIGPKGRMLVVDSHPDPYRDPYRVGLGFDNEGGNVTHRSLMRDAPFTLSDTVDFEMGDPYVYADTQFSGQPAVSSFHDSMGYYPGSEYVRRGPAYPTTQFKWVTTQWDASAVVPARSDYALKAPGYTANEEFRFNCVPYLEGPSAGYLSCYWFGSGVGLGYDGGTGNPGDDGVQYGWHVELIEESADHSWAKVRIWNSMKELDDELSAAPASVVQGAEIDYAYHVERNVGSAVRALVVVPLPQSVEYVPGSVSGGAMPLPVGMSAGQAAAIYAQGGRDALEELVAAQAGAVGAVAWDRGPLGTGEGGGEFGFSVRALVPGEVDLSAQVYDEATQFQVTPAEAVKVLYGIYLPVLMRR